MKLLTLPLATLALTLSLGAAQANDHGGHHKHGKTVTKTEYMNKAEQRFEKMDANNDGTLTRDERKAAMKDMHKHKKHWKHGKKKHHEGKYDRRHESDAKAQLHGEHAVKKDRVIER